MIIFTVYLASENANKTTPTSVCPPVYFNLLYMDDFVRLMFVHNYISSRCVCSSDH